MYKIIAIDANTAVLAINLADILLSGKNIFVTNFAKKPTMKIKNITMRTRSNVSIKIKDLSFKAKIGCFFHPDFTVAT